MMLVELHNLVSLSSISYFVSLFSSSRHVFLYSFLPLSSRLLLLGRGFSSTSDFPHQHRPRLNFFEPFFNSPSTNIPSSQVLDLSRRRTPKCRRRCPPVFYPGHLPPGRPVFYNDLPRVEFGRRDGIDPSAHETGANVSVPPPLPPLPWAPPVEYKTTMEPSRRPLDLPLRMYTSQISWCRLCNVNNDRSTVNIPS